jgi:hypothetical protein
MRTVETKGVKREGTGNRKLREVTGAWRKLHNEELHNLYSSYINRVIK